jgi:phosphoribosylglycinamide formyltransferase-1
VPALFNLVADLDERRLAEPPKRFNVAEPVEADERTLAWIDDVFGGWWSSEAYAGANIIARAGTEPVGFVTIDAGMKFSWLDGLAREPGVGVIGPFGVAPGSRSQGLGTALVRAGLNALMDRGYERAVIGAVGSEELARYYAEAASARVAERFDRAALLRPRRRTLILASGNGSNFQAVLDAARSGVLPIEVVALLSDNPHAYAIERARAAGLDSRVVSWNRAVEPRAEFDARLLEAAGSVEPDLVLLLGWMHLLSDSFVGTFPEMLNVHPAFLPLDPERDDVVMPDGTRTPAFRGPRAVRDALAASCVWVGATVHRVTGDTDRGPVLARKPLRVKPGEEEAPLMERVHEREREVVRAGVMRWLYER